MNLDMERLRTLLSEAAPAPAESSSLSVPQRGVSAPLDKVLKDAMAGSSKRPPSWLDEPGLEPTYDELMFMPGVGEAVSAAFSGLTRKTANTFLKTKRGRALLEGLARVRANQERAGLAVVKDFADEIPEYATGAASPWKNYIGAPVEELKRAFPDVEYIHGVMGHGVSTGVNVNGPSEAIRRVFNGVGEISVSSTSKRAPAVPFAEAGLVIEGGESAVPFWRDVYSSVDPVDGSRVLGAESRRRGRLNLLATKPKAAMSSEELKSGISTGKIDGRSDTYDEIFVRKPKASKGFVYEPSLRRGLSQFDVVEALQKAGIPVHKLSKSGALSEQPIEELVKTQGLVFSAEGPSSRTPPAVLRVTGVGEKRFSPEISHVRALRAGGHKFTIHHAGEKVLVGGKQVDVLTGKDLESYIYRLDSSSIPYNNRRFDEMLYGHGRTSNRAYTVMENLSAGRVPVIDKSRHEDLHSVRHILWVDKSKIKTIK